jgi:hypothetical protein
MRRSILLTPLRSGILVAPIRSQHATARRSSLDLLICAIENRSIARIDADDIYKICALLPPPVTGQPGRSDALGMCGNTKLLHALKSYQQRLDPAAVPSFQWSVIENALSGVEASQQLDASSSTGLAVAAPEPEAVQKEVDEVEERLKAIWEIVNDAKSREQGAKTSEGVSLISHDEMMRVVAHCRALRCHMRKLSATGCTSLAQALVTVNFQDTDFTDMLARRCCEIAKQLTSPNQVAKLYLNLSKLRAHDSLVAILNVLQTHMSSMDSKVIINILQAIDRQPHQTAASSKFMHALVRHLQISFDSVFGTVNNSAVHRYLLAAMARYELGRVGGVLVQKVAQHVLPFAPQMSERDACAILHSLVNLNAAASLQPTFATLLGRLDDLVPVMDLRNIEFLVDTVSMIPVDTSAIMNKVMDRITIDASKINTLSAQRISELLAQYPPAGEHPCMAALCMATCLRKESLDPEGVESLVLSFASAHLFTNRYYCEIVDFCLENRNGLRSLSSLARFLEVAALTQSNGALKLPSPAEEIAAKFIQKLVGQLTDEELNQLRSVMMKFGIKDCGAQKHVLQRMRVQQRQRRGGSAPRDPEFDQL